MNHVRPERPTLATLVCIFEVFTVILAIAMHFLLIYQHHHLQAQHAYLQSLHPSFHLLPVKPLPHLTPVHIANSYLDYDLALAAAIALWQMRRAAFWFLAAHFVIGLLWFLHAIPFLLAQHWPSLPPGSPLAFNEMVIRWGGYLFSVGSLIFSASVARYAYAITTPRFQPPPLSAPEAAS